VALTDAADKGAYPDLSPGGQLVTFGRKGVVAATAWDDNGTTEPLVEIAVSGFDRPGAGGALLALATGAIDVGAQGVLVGSFLTQDLKLIADVPTGRYQVLVSADALVPMTARRVTFHLWPA
jgi:hypothetical protein